MTTLRLIALSLLLATVVCLAGCTSAQRNNLLLYGNLSGPPQEEPEEKP